MKRKSPPSNPPRKTRALAAGPSPTEGAPEFQHQVGAVLEQLRASISAVIEAIPAPGPISRAIDLQRALGIRSTLAWQVHKLGSSADPVAAGTGIPGSAALRRFFKAAASRGVSKNILQSAARAADQVQAFVKAHAGDRGAFHSMISGLRHSGSAHVDLQHKRAAFKAQSHIWGVQARTQLATSIVQPSSDDPARGDAIGLSGFIDLKRFRPEARVTLFRLYANDSDGRVRHTPSRAPIDAVGLQAHGISLLTEFSTRPAPRFEVIPGMDDEVTLEMEGDKVGNRSRVTCLTGDVLRGALTRYRDEHNSHETMTACVRVPCEVLICDMLIHEGMYPGTLSPAVNVYSTVGGEPRAQRKEVDLLPLRETITYLGRGPSVLATPHVPRYSEMVEYALSRVGWNGNRFLVYRCRVEYPVMPSSVVVQYDLPERSGTSA